MPLPRVPLRAFLAAAKTAARNANSASAASPVTFVVGNESADLDSLCSAIVLAYLRTYAPTSTSNTFYIPLSNLPKADLALRPELSPILSRANISLNDFITLSDVQLSSLSQSVAESTRWVLVDHNALQGELGSGFGDRVVGCIDHHDEENKVPVDTVDEPRVVQKCGSCASLVVQYCKDSWDSVSHEKQDEVPAWNAELAYVALAPILIDTTHLKDESKTTEIDRQAVEFLKSTIMAVPGHQFDDEAYFNELSTAKESMDGLQLSEILRKDYKQWTENSLNLGISSAVKNLSYLINKAESQDDFLAVVKQFAEERKLSIFCIMTTSQSNGKFQRELFAWALDERGVKSIKKFVEQSTSDLGLDYWGEGRMDDESDGNFRRAWWQRKVANSRKQVAPKLRDSML